MGEAEWDSSTDPQAMLSFLRIEGRASDRRLRLWGCACARKVWHLLTRNGSRQAIVDAEALADGSSERRWLERARAEANQAAVGGPGYAGYAAALVLSDEPTWLERATKLVAYVWEWEVNDDGTRQEVGLGLHRHSSERGQRQRRVQCDLLRDIASPFRSPFATEPAWLAWNNGTVAKLATVIYEERQLPSGHLVASCLGVLADALENSGFYDPVVLEHLRQPGLVHVRGCRPIDLLLQRD